MIQHDEWEVFVMLPELVASRALLDFLDRCPAVNLRRCARQPWFSSQCHGMLYFVD